MKRLFIILISLLTMMTASHSVKAQQVTIDLLPGWNYIAYPYPTTVELNTFLSSITPMNGDIIKSFYGSSLYLNGRWRGAITILEPGVGYHYFSNNPNTVALVWDNPIIPDENVAVTTSEPTDVNVNSATCGGIVASNDGSYVAIDMRGVCWSTHPHPTFNDNYVEAGNVMGSFTVSLTELNPGVTYYIRAFAVTSQGTFFGNEVSFHTLDHGYVDLGLPSGLLWAACNVGAENSEDYGDYFAWGETTTKSTYNWSTYQYCNGSYNTLTKYCNNSSYGYNGFTDNLTTLLPEDDAATANWGNGWRMPTQTEFQELRDNTTVTWTTQNGVKGRLFTASNGNSLFLPAAGYRDNSGLYYAGSSGNYWSSSLYTGSPHRAWYFYFDSGNSGVSYDIRSGGRSVRPVYSLQPGTVQSIVIAMPNDVIGGIVANTQQDQTITLTATANEGYTFTNWTENDEVVSTEATYTFTVTGDRTLVANFTLNSYTVTAAANPSQGGSVMGAGTFDHGTSVTLTATANEGYTFTNWTENGSVVSTNATYTFTVTGDRTLVAKFTQNGAINGLFSVSASQQVYFSRGNLQYQASTNTWKFAENQWDMIGSENSNISENYVGWIDLFGWGTSGYHDANDPYNVNYQPWSTSTSPVNSSYNEYGYGPSTNMTDRNLTGTSSNYDWGVYNPISNGGNQAGQWRTLTRTEWIYVFYTRTTTSGIRYAKAKVNNINGVILLPDDWSSSIYNLNNTNIGSASFSSNTLTATQWSILEQAGAVFLPAAGLRLETSVGVGPGGYYWSASYSGSNSAYYVGFSDSNLSTNYYGDRYFGRSVRLVCPAEN